MPHLITTLGPLGPEALGPILPHEHIFVDLRTWDQRGYGEGDPEDVIRLMAPEIERARAVGVTAIIEPGPIGVGRRADILLAVSQATGFPLVAPTGIYREPWLPPWAHEATEGAIQDWMVGELTGEIEESGVQAGWIKVGSTDAGMTASEAKVLRAAAGAALETGATIGSHTVRGEVARAQLDLIEGSGAPADSFIWIHAHQEPEVAIHHELARRGAWIEYDGIGDPGDDAKFLDLVLRALDAGFSERILLSHDRGWYDPAQPGGGVPKPFTPLMERFLPELAGAGVDDATIDRLVRENPFAAFARQ